MEQGEPGLICPVSLLLSVSRLDPAGVSEVLTVRQVCILREHTVRNLEATRIFHLVLSLESIKVTFFLHYIERFYGINVLFAILSRISSHQFQTDSIVQALLVDNVSNGVFLTAFDRTFNQLFRLFARYDLNAIPLGNNFLFPYAGCVYRTPLSACSQPLLYCCCTLCTSLAAS